METQPWHCCHHRGGQGLTGIPDLAPHAKLIKKYKGAGQHQRDELLIGIAEGGLWPGDRAAECTRMILTSGRCLLGPMPDCHCRLCGAPVEDEMHIA